MSNPDGSHCISPIWRLSDIDPNNQSVHEQLSFIEEHIYGISSSREGESYWENEVSKKLEDPHEKRFIKQSTGLSQKFQDNLAKYKQDNKVEQWTTSRIPEFNMPRIKVETRQSEQMKAALLRLQAEGENSISELHADLECLLPSTQFSSYNFKF